MSEWEEVLLKDISSYGEERVKLEQINLLNYISTENMNPNREGVTVAASLPAAKTVSGYSSNDILISNIRPYFKKIWFADKEGGCSNDVLVIRNKHQDQVVSKYLYYNLFTDHFFDYVMTGAKGAKMPRGDKEEIMKYPLLLPPLNIQKKIVSILSNIDDKIQINLNMNKTLEEIAITLYKHWFIDFGPFQDGDFTETELGEIPKDWEVKNLKDIANILMGQSPKSEFYNQKGDGLPFHQGVANFGIRFPTNITYSTKLLRVAEEGDFLISVRAPVGRLNVAHTKMVIGRGLSAISSKTNNSSFLFYTLKTIFSEEDKYGSGTIFNSINKGDLENLKVIVPPETIINEYESKVSVYDSLINRNHEQILLLTDTRDYLLPRLLSGEIDVSEAAEIVKEVISNEQPEPSV